MSAFEKKSFFSKIMLLGEYSIINGGKAFTAPYARFNGHLAYLRDSRYKDFDFAQKSNQQLKALLKHLEGLQEKEAFFSAFKIDMMRENLDSGLYFESNIPQGYGIGSSGAMIAALFHQYMDKEEYFPRILSQKSLQEIRTVLSAMESYYHGNSSGLDPLISYIGKPLLVNSFDNVENIELPEFPTRKDAAVFLIDAGLPGPTKPLVDWYLKRSKEGGLDVEKHININNKAIETITQSSFDDFYASLLDISLFQHQYFHPMIIPEIRPVWEQGLQKEKWLLKLCGSGGGGFYLGFTHNFNIARREIEKHGFKVIPAYQG